MLSVRIFWKIVNFSSPELKAQVSFSVCLLFVCPSVRKLFSHFNLLLQNHWANFIKLGTKHPWMKRIQVNSNERPCLSPRGDNTCSIIVKLGYIKNILKSSNSEQLGQFPPNLTQIILEWKRFKFV